MTKTSALLLPLLVVAVAVTPAPLRAAPAGGQQPPTPAGSAREKEPLTLKVSTHVAPEPAEVAVRMRVEPDPRSRSLLVEWWSLDGIGGTHFISMEGERAAMRHDYSIKRMEAGEYTVSAVLERNDGSVVKRQTKVVVVGEGSRFGASSEPGTGDLAELIAPPPRRGR